MDNHNRRGAIGREEDAIVADAAAEDALPLLALQGFHVPSERVVGHLRQRARDALLDRFRQRGEIFFRPQG